MNNIKVLLIIIQILIAQGCDSTAPENNKAIKLSLEDVSCTETWLSIKIDNISLPIEVSLMQNDKLQKTMYINNIDTLLYLDSLLPNQTYQYQLTSNKHSIMSYKVQVTTLDTTSQNFIWESFTFSGNGNSILRDVAIIGENNIWAVGTIHTKETDQFDSNGVWVQPYNAVHWDGNKWELKRIMFYTDQDQPIAGQKPSKCEAAYLFNDGILAISSNVQTAMLDSDGTTGIIRMGFKWEDRFTINAIWGASSSDFYVVGNNGNVAYYNGKEWKKIESGTDVDLVDIWGNTDGNTIWVCGNEDFKPTVLLKIKDEQTKRLYSSSNNLFSYNFSQLSGNFRSIWTDNKDFLYILTSYDLYRIKNEDLTKPKALWRDVDDQIATIRARGLGMNDIFTVGYEGLLCHFNGLSWETYNELYKRFKTYLSIAVKGSTVVAVGQDYTNGIEDKAIITITKR